MRTWITSQDQAPVVVYFKVAALHRTDSEDCWDWVASVTAGEIPAAAAEAWATVARVATSTVEARTGTRAQAVEARGIPRRKLPPLSGGEAAMGVSR